MKKFDTSVLIEKESSSRRRNRETHRTRWVLHTKSKKEQQKVSHNTDRGAVWRDSDSGGPRYTTSRPSGDRSHQYSRNT